MVVTPDHGSDGASRFPIEPHRDDRVGVREERYGAGNHVHLSWPVEEALIGNLAAASNVGVLHRAVLVASVLIG